MKLKASRTLLAFVLSLACTFLHAGRPCHDQKNLTVEVVERSLSLALKTQAALDDSGAQVVVMARAGQDLTAYNLHYSHLGFVYRQPDGMGGHAWRVLHKLNQCGTPESSIYRQGLGEFFLDDLWQYEAAWIVPTDEVQRKLIAVLTQESAAIKLHHPRYSMVSYVWGQTYQQSNQWVIETMALAMASDAKQPVTNRLQAQSWLQENGYLPGVLNIGPVKRLGARLTKANVAFDDHPNEKRFSNRFETVTADSVFEWLPRAGLTQKPLMKIK